MDRTNGFHRASYLLALEDAFELIRCEKNLLDALVLLAEAVNNQRGMVDEESPMV